MKLFPKKSLGQNFLIDQKVIELITEISKISSKDNVLEVGPGTGALTHSILKKKPKNFTVIEKDENLAKKLMDKYGNEVNVINDDMMKFSYKNFEKNNLIIFGNLPYNISTQILAKWIKIENLDQFCKKFILMFQKEVADRIIAKTNTKQYGRLTILSNWKMKIEKIIDVEPYSFKPSPKVKSTLLTLVPQRKFYKIKDVRNLEHITNIFFSQRRKMIKKPLKFLFRNSEKISSRLALDLSLRPQNLERKIYYRLCEIYESLIN